MLLAACHKDTSFVPISFVASMFRLCCLFSRKCVKNRELDKDRRKKVVGLNLQVGPVHTPDTGSVKFSVALRKDDDE